MAPAVILEGLLVGLLVVAGILAMAGGPRRARSWTAVAVSPVLALGGAALLHHRTEARAASRAELLEKIPSQGRPDGYVSSDACRACHPDQYASWHRSFHRTMTQAATPEAVRAPFDGVDLELAGERYALGRRGDAFWAEMPDPDWQHDRHLDEQDARAGRASPPRATGDAPPRAARRVTLVTGSHHMQAYWIASREGNQQFSFPFTYLFEESRWVPRNAVFLMDPRVPPFIQTWNFNCVNCHATAGQPRLDPQTLRVDSRVAELGIACEACHGPAGEHVRANASPWRRYALHFSMRPDPTIVHPKRLSPRAASEVCGQCHAVTGIRDRADWMANGFRYRPGEDLAAYRPVLRSGDPALGAPLPQGAGSSLREGYFWSDGTVRVSGREYNGLVESACHVEGDLSCLSCHSMHESDPDDQLARGMEGNGACLPCHDAIARAPREHTHHPPESSGSLCYNCHMPHATYGLLKAIRNHRIDNPSVQVSLQTGRPNACNLCHLDRTLAWTQERLSEWYGTRPADLPEEERTISAAVLWATRGDAGQRALLAWHFGWEPAWQASGQDWLAPYLAQLLDDPYLAVRYIAGRSLKRLPGYASLPWDFIGSAEERARTRERALEIWAAKAPGIASPRPAVLLDPDGRLDRRTLAALLARRDDRSMQLLE